MSLDEEVFKVPYYIWSDCEFSGDEFREDYPTFIDLFQEIDSKVSFSAVAKIVDRITNQQPINVAYSGGPDSTALVLWLYNFVRSYQHKEPKILLHYMDHGIRDNSNDIEIVESLARLCNLELTIHHPRQDLSKGSNVEERARQERKAAFPTDVLTAHHLDDSVETMFLNLLRGTGLSGMGMREVPNRPFSRIRKSLLAQWVDEFLGVRVVHDETNDQPLYRRNRVRHELLPLLNDIAGKDVVPNLERFMDICHDSQVLLERHAEAKYRENLERMFGKKHKSDALVRSDVLGTLGKMEGVVLLRSRLSKAGIFPSHRALFALYDVVIAANSKFQLPGDFLLEGLSESRDLDGIGRIMSYYLVRVNDNEL